MSFELKKIIAISLVWPSLALAAADKGAGPLQQTFFPSEYFAFNGKVFLNASNASLKGTDFLLNQQLTNIKLNTDFYLPYDNKIHTLFIYNSAPNPVNPEFYFDEAFLHLKTSFIFQNTYANIGKKWLTFGNYKNDLIYKPLTKALGQTNEYTIEAGYENKYYANISLFKPQSPIRSSNLPLYYNLNAGLRDTIDDHDFDVGASFLYSIAEAQLFQFNKGFRGFLDKTINSHVPGFAAYSNYRYKQWTAYLTYVTATTRFKNKELSFQNHAATPSAISFQGGYEFTIKNVPLKAIALYDKSFEALGLLVPEQRIGAALNIAASRFLDIQFEAYKDYSYKTNAVASGLNSKVMQGNSEIANTVAMQLVIKF